MWRFLLLASNGMEYAVTCTTIREAVETIKRRYKVKAFRAIKRTRVEKHESKEEMAFAV